MKPWKDLSMKERGAFIRVGVKNGITSVDGIRDAYNKFAYGGHKFGDGGYKKDVSAVMNTAKEEGDEMMPQSLDGITVVAHHTGDISKRELYNGEEGVYRNPEYGEKINREIEKRWRNRFAESVNQQKNQLRKRNYATKQIYGALLQRARKEEAEHPNYADETIRKTTEYPLLYRKENGELGIKHYLRMNGFRSPMEIVSPEFYVLTLGASGTGSSLAKQGLSTAGRVMGTALNPGWWADQATLGAERLAGKAVSKFGSGYGLGALKSGLHYLTGDVAADGLTGGFSGFGSSTIPGMFTNAYLGTKMGYDAYMDLRYNPNRTWKDDFWDAFGVVGGISTGTELGIKSAPEIVNTSIKGYNAAKNGIINPLNEHIFNPRSKTAQDYTKNAVYGGIANKLVDAALLNTRWGRMHSFAPKYREWRMKYWPILNKIAGIGDKRKLAASQAEKAATDQLARTIEKFDNYTEWANIVKKSAGLQANYTKESRSALDYVDPDHFPIYYNYLPFLKNGRRVGANILGQNWRSTYTGTPELYINMRRMNNNLLRTRLPNTLVHELNHRWAMESKDFPKTFGIGSRTIAGKPTFGYTYPRQDEVLLDDIFNTDLLTNNAIKLNAKESNRIIEKQATLAELESFLFDKFGYDDIDDVPGEVLFDIVSNSEGKPCLHTIFDDMRTDGRHSAYKEDYNNNWKRGFDDMHTDLERRRYVADLEYKMRRAIKKAFGLGGYINSYGLGGYINNYGLGGNIFDGTTQDTQQMQTGWYPEGLPWFARDMYDDIYKAPVIDRFEGTDWYVGYPGNENEEEIRYNGMGVLQEVDITPESRHQYYGDPSWILSHTPDIFDVYSYFSKQYEDNDKFSFDPKMVDYSNVSEEDFKNSTNPILLSKDMHMLLDHSKKSKAYYTYKMLDAVAEQYSKAGVPLIYMLGHPYKETTWGNPTIDKSRNKLTGGRENIKKTVQLHWYLDHEDPNHFDMTPSNMLSYSNPYKAALNYVKDHHSLDKAKNYDDYINRRKLQEEGLIDGYRYARKLASERSSDNNPFYNIALEFSTGRYNSNQSDYYKLVEDLGRDMLSQPDVQEWIENQHYYNPDPEVIEQEFQNYKKNVLHK